MFLTLLACSIFIFHVSRVVSISNRLLINLARLANVKFNLVDF